MRLGSDLYQTSHPLERWGVLQNVRPFVRTATSEDSEEDYLGTTPNDDVVVAVERPSSRRKSTPSTTARVRTRTRR